MKTLLLFDFETYNELDLKASGLSRYVRHTSLDIILASWSLDDAETVKQYDRFADGERLPNEFLDALEDERVQKMAWNFPFEQNVTKQALGIDIPAETATDPMVVARALSMPGALAEVCRILNLPESEWKHTGGKALINLFCKPRKPTPKNPSTRNTAATHPEKWAKFRAYNVADIRAMAGCWFRMKKWNLPEFEWELWEYDQQINRAGIPVNLRSIDNANRIVDALTQASLDELTRITRLENANSGPQLLGWLKERAYPFDDLKVGHVKRALKEAVDEGDGETKYASALRRRTEVSKASIKKYAAYDAMSDDDGLLRWMLTFNGAGRTCRWTGSGLQVHNVARPHWFFELAEAQERLAHHIARLSPRDFAWLYTRPGKIDPFEALSSGVRGEISAPEGYVFVSADFNAIENRVLGYMADEERILNVFLQDRCPYVDFATYMFGGTYEELWHEYKVLKQKTKRQIAKPGVLGCFGPDTPVLTDRGWVRIVDVRADDLVHDGDCFVTHGGVAFRGLKEVLCRSGVHATPDHKIEVSGEWVPFCQLAFQPQSFRQALASASGRLLRTRAVLDLPERSTFVGARADLSGQLVGRTLSEAYRRNARDARLRLDAAVLENGLVQTCSTFSQIVSTLREVGARTPKIQLTRTTEGGEFVCGSVIATSGSNTLSITSGRTEHSKLIEQTITGTTSGETFGSQLGQSRTQTSDTWDVVNAGPNHRFVVLSSDGPLIVHNCGYMLSAGFEYEDASTGEMLATGLLGYGRGMGIDLTPEQSEKSVRVWRETYSKVSDRDDGLWYELDRAMRKTVGTGKRTSVNMFEFERDGPFVTARLPSGRKLFYIRPRIEDRKTPWGEMRPTITYEGIDSHSTRKVWGRVSTHPGKITENLDQALARDALAHALLRLKRRNVNIIATRSNQPLVDVRLHVHDEIIALAREDDAERVGRVLSEAMSEPMEWAPGLPLKAVPEISKVFVKT